MRADLCASTGGNALAYDPAMRNTIITLSLSLAFIAACSDDSMPRSGAGFQANRTVRRSEARITSRRGMPGSSRSISARMVAVSSGSALMPYHPCPYFAARRSAVTVAAQ